MKKFFYVFLVVSVISGSLRSLGFEHSTINDLLNLTGIFSLFIFIALWLGKKFEKRNKNTRDKASRKQP